MFDLLSKEKEKVDDAKLSLAVCRTEAKLSVHKAKTLTTDFVHSPTGLGGAFLLGSLKGATSSNTSTGGVLLSFVSKLALTQAVF